jgi:hypothetical protein
MRSYRFKVDGHLPPKKTGELSQFSKPVEAARTIALRVAALTALAGGAPLQRHIRLTLIVHLGRRNDRSMGDLDNYITGVCDGLMKADPRAHLHYAFEDPGLADIHPLRPIGMLDDVEVLEIHARKIIGDTDVPWYEVTLEGE